MYKILPESAGFCRRCDKNIFVFFSGSQFQLPFTYKTRTLILTGEVEALFRWRGNAYIIVWRIYLGQDVL